MGNSPRAAEALARATSVHTSHGALHRKNYGAGEKLWATDYCEKDINQVSIVVTGIRPQTNTDTHTFYITFGILSALCATSLIK